MWIYLAVALIAGATAAAGTWRVQDWRYGAKEKERLQAIEVQRRTDEKRIDVAAAGHEKDKRSIDTRFVVITEKVEHALQDNFYAAGELCFDDAGVRALADAAGPRAAASEPARTVPAAEPAR